MPKFKVTLTATVFQEVLVEAEDEDFARENAFCCMPPTVDGGDGHSSIKGEWDVLECEECDEEDGE